LQAKLNGEIRGEIQKSERLFQENKCAIPKFLSDAGKVAMPKNLGCALSAIPKFLSDAL
jgi:hypothetical protein